MTPEWLLVQRGTAPLIVTLPHAGTRLPDDIAVALVSPWLARKDADWWVDQLYGFAAALGATLISTLMSRSVIDVNRDPTGVALYPGRPGTSLCPTTSFDGEPLYRAGAIPGAAEIARRREAYFAPYHAALAAEIIRLRHQHGKVVLYDAHSIRSVIPRLFEGQLPHCNIGSNRGSACDPRLTDAIADRCAASSFSHITDGRFVGGWTTRTYGCPAEGIHAVQMELACRGYLDEPAQVTPDNWPPAFDPVRAAPLSALLTDILTRCIAFAHA
jgi:formiminoglutamase